jgi:serine/threonine-protein kinase RsbW
MSSTYQTSSVQLESDLESIPQLLNWFEQCRGSSIPDQVWLEAQTALLEGFTNAARHAHAALPLTTPIEVCLHHSAQGLQIQIFDQGDAFDLDLAWQNLSQHPNRAEEDPFEREAHWGILLLLKLKNEYGWSIGYQQPSDQRNCLVMTRRWG